jgi:hypothetical protein
MVPEKYRTFEIVVIAAGLTVLGFVYAGFFRIDPLFGWRQGRSGRPRKAVDKECRTDDLEILGDLRVLAVCYPPP